MITTPWDNIHSATLQALCDDGAAKSSTLDFKRDASKTQIADPEIEFAKDVCAFANASGGDLVYGIEERQHVALRPAPFSGEPFDACARRFTQVLVNHVEPRIAGILFKEAPFVDQSDALIVRVPASIDAPQSLPRPRAHRRALALSLCHALEHGNTRHGLRPAARCLRAHRDAHREGEGVGHESPGFDGQGLPAERRGDQPEILCARDPDRRPSPNTRHLTIRTASLMITGGLGAA